MDTITDTSLNSSDIYKGIYELAAQQCAPVIFGIKPSNLLIIDREYAKGLKSLITSTGLRIRCLYHYSQRQIWFLYNEYSLTSFINDPENRAFIEKYGYSEGMNLTSKLTILEKRFIAYKKGYTGFPHEMGVFLGYPLCDVKGFIENDGKNYKYTGYWKVYGDVTKAKKTFKKYENVKKYALSLVNSGIRFDKAPVYKMAI